MSRQELRLARVSVSGDARSRLAAMREAHPEWAAWLTLYGETLTADDDPAWDQAAAAADLQPQSAGQPLLSDAIVHLPAGLAETWLQRLLPGASDAPAVLEATINHDGEQLAARAARTGMDLDEVEAVADLAVMPLLRALGRRLAGAVSPDWHSGFCPICGAWPAMAESRGLERARRPRCGRCGGDWGIIALRCPYCETADHRQLGSLVSDEDAESRRVETCSVCHGYLKTAATLRPWAADEIPLVDLATVELDLAARERGFERPASPAAHLGLRIVTTHAASNGAVPPQR